MKILYSVDPTIKEYAMNFEPQIIRINKFDEASAKVFSETMEKAHNSGQTVIPVIIDSYGGYAHSLLAMISDIRSSDLPVATVVKGKAMSCGAILMTYGTPGFRFVDPMARIMVHEVASGDIGKVSEIEASTKELKYLNTSIYAEMAQNCGQVKDFFINKIKEHNNADWFLSPKEAIKIGMADHAKMPVMRRDIKVDYSFEF